MNPELFRLGSVILRSYTAFIGLGVLVTVGLLAWRGGRSAAAWLDVGIAGAAGGMVGARLLHAVFNWDYFHAYPLEIMHFWSGGYEWHGALFGALLAGYIAARVRAVPLEPLMATAAVALPVFTALMWAGCLLSNCGYGQEVRSLADYPALVVAELPDLYYTVAPRFNTQLFGIAWSVVVLGVVMLLPHRSKRLWIGLLVYSAGMLVAGGLRADPVPSAAGLRLDQWFDIVVIALVLFILRKERKQHNGTQT